MSQKKSDKTTTKKKSKQGQATKTSTSLIAPNTIVTLTIPAKDVKKKYQAILKKLAAKVKSDGFRQGKIPLKIAEETIGKSKVINQVLQDLLPQLYHETIEKQQKKPLTQPRFNPIQIKMGEEWQVEAHFAEKPVVSTKNFQKIIKEAKKQADKHIKEAEKNLKKQVTQAKKAASTASKQKDTKKAAKIGPQALTEQQKKDTTLQFVFKDLIAKLKPAIPQLLVEEETKRELEKFAQSIAKMNLKIEDYLKSQQINFEKLSQQMAASALGKLQLDFILNEITLKEKIEVVESDIRDYLKKIKDQNFKEKLKKDPGYQRYLKSILSRQKTMDYLLKL